MIDMTLDEYLAIPETLDVTPPGAIYAVVIPGSAEELHDSGYRCVSFVFFGRDQKMLGRSGTHSDSCWVYPTPQAGRHQTIQATGYERVEMDWLPKSGLLRFWLNGADLEAGEMLLSSALFRPQNQRVNDFSPREFRRVDQLRDIEQRMREWIKAYGADQIAVTLDAALEKS